MIHGRISNSCSGGSLQIAGAKHIQSRNGQFIFTQGSCFQKATIYPNQAILNKHRTCHQQQACKVCGKNVGSLRSLKRHEKSKHKKRTNRQKQRQGERKWREKTDRILLFVWLQKLRNSNCLQAFLKAGVRLLPMLPMNHWILGFRRVPKIAVGVQSTQKFVFFQI